MHALKKLFTLLFLMAPVFMIAQEEEPPIHLTNPSFEDLPQCCEAPTGWYNCGKADETAPDIQPGAFEVTKMASNGQTYLGLVTRDNDTWESVAQRLSRPLEMQKCYEFSLDLCRAENYVSLSKTTGEEANYATPSKLRIYGGNGYCDRKELLAETSVIVNTRWLRYNFKLSPKLASYSYIILEAYYRTPILFPTNGNILVDNASPIQPVSCGPAAIAAKPEVKVPDRKIPKRPTVPTTNGTNKTPTPTASKSTIKRTGMKKGSIIKLDKIYFDANKYEIKDVSVPALEDVLAFLEENPDVIIEIGGHTNNRPSPSFANELSKNRAKSVADWLIEKGIPNTQVQYKGYGKTMPIETNETPEGRRANQRVEIKVLDMDNQ
ncbi:MAG: OmpA family protein [Saprospiraceae bacterium]